MPRHITHSRLLLNVEIFQVGFENIGALQSWLLNKDFDGTMKKKETKNVKQT